MLDLFRPQQQKDEVDHVVLCQSEQFDDALPLVVAFAHLEEKNAHQLEEFSLHQIQQQKDEANYLKLHQNELELQILQGVVVCHQIEEESVNFAQHLNVPLFYDGGDGSVSVQV